MSTTPVDEAALVDEIARLEREKSAACARQAVLTVVLDRRVRAREAAAGVPALRRGRGVAGQVALSRQESPYRGEVLLGLAHDLHTDLPHTLAALAEGRLNEERAMVVASETGCLDRDDRAAGDERGKGQLMADLFVERVTGQTTAAAVPVCIDLVISDQTLLAAGHQPAEIPGHGPVPAQIARELAARALDGEVPVWLRRLYADPSGHLVAMTSKQRFAPDGLASFVGLRDAGICRTPWCDAPIRHVDHIDAIDDGGQTTDANTQGLCEQCNHTKQASGWHQRPVLGDRHIVETTTPTGHRYRLRAPGLPTPLRPERVCAASSPAEIFFRQVVVEHAAA